MASRGERERLGHLQHDAARDEPPARRLRHGRTVLGHGPGHDDVLTQDYVYAERTYGAFERSFELPLEVESAKVTAKMKDGILNIVVPKSVTAQKAAKTITVQPG